MNYSKPTQGIIGTIYAPDLKAQGLPETVLLLDVREEFEWNEGHIEGATHIPLGKIMEGRTQDLPKDQEIIFYCKSGMRSMQAAQIMQSRGYESLTNMEGGFEAWDAA